jgi:hypothetical protein
LVHRQGQEEVHQWVPDHRQGEEGVASEPRQREVHRGEEVAPWVQLLSGVLWEGLRVSEVVPWDQEMIREEQLPVAGALHECQQQSVIVFTTKVAEQKRKYGYEYEPSPPP